MLRQFQHVLWQLDVRWVLEVERLIPHFIGIAQCCSEKAVVPSLQHDDALALGEDDPADGDHVLVSHGVADHGEGVPAHAIIRIEVVGAVETTCPHSNKA